MPPKYSFDVEGNMPFGAIQGRAPGGIPAFSNGHDHFFSGERSVDGTLFCGYKYQCVEFARRWLFERKGLVLPDINWACHAFKLSDVANAETGEAVATQCVRNGTSAKPTADAFIVYPSDPNNIVGHIGVITEVGDDCVYVADQNYRFHDWNGATHAYKLPLKHDAAANTWTIVDDLDANDIQIPLGWVEFPGVPNRAEGAAPLKLHPSLHAADPAKPYLIRRTFIPTETKPNWLDLNNQAERLFVEEFGMDVSRSRLDESEASYYEMNMEMHIQCTAYGVQLHRMFLEATAQVIASDEKLQLFGIPETFWPRLRYSFEHQRTYISGRFDFAYNNETGEFKCFEYNADSASTMLECGRIQAKWAASVGLDKTSTRSSGSMMERNLQRAWAHCGAKGRVHFCVDNDKEEMYTALFCMEGAVNAGLEGKLCVMFDEFHFDENGRVVDSDEVPVRNIWKTWMWESAFSDYFEAKKERGENWKPSKGDKVRLCDLLLGDDWDILVFEPMWKVIPSNKAILPMIYHNHPDHPALLKSEYELTDALRHSGYAKKPIVGRVGRNVTITESDGDVKAQSDGNYGERDMIYQELFKLTLQDGYYAIIGGWMLGDAYSGTGIREDKTIITGLESPFSAIRIAMPTMPKPVTHDDLDKTAEDE